MAGTIDPGRVAAVRLHVYDALTRTGEHSVLPDEEQDRLLAQVCGEVCDLLGGWLESPTWTGLCPAPASGRKTVAGASADWERLRPFLGPVQEAITRMSARQADVPGAPETGDPAEYVDRLIQSAERTGRRHRPFTRQQLYDVATGRLGTLRDQACAIAGSFRRAADRKQRWARARAMLTTAAGILFTISVTMASVTPAMMAQNIPAWGHEAITVLFVHHIAQTAAPAVSVAPPRPGLRPG